MGTRLTYPGSEVSLLMLKSKFHIWFEQPAHFKEWLIIVFFKIIRTKKAYFRSPPYQGKGRSGLAFASLIHLSLLLNDLIGLPNNKKSQGSESSYTIVAGGASASGEGNQMAEKTRMKTYFCKQPLVVCRFIERRRQSFFLTNKIGAPKVRHSIGCSRTYSRSKIARRHYNTSLTSSRLSLSKSERSHKSSIRQFLFQPSNEVPVGLPHSLVQVCSVVTS